MRCDEIWSCVLTIQSINSRPIVSYSKKVYFPNSVLVSCRNNFSVIYNKQILPCSNGSHNDAITFISGIANQSTLNLVISRYIIERNKLYREFLTKWTLFQYRAELAFYVSTIIIFLASCVYSNLSSGVRCVSLCEYNTVINIANVSCQSKHAPRSFGLIGLWHLWSKIKLIQLVIRDAFMSTLTQIENFTHLLWYLLCKRKKHLYLQMQELKFNHL